MSEFSSNKVVGLDTLLFTIFLVMKLTGVIDWSWWWVTAPLWISFLIGIFIGAVVLIVKYVLEHKDEIN